MSLTKNILHAVFYADIFQYPMTIREIVRWLPTKRQIAKKIIQKDLSNLVKRNELRFIAPFVVVKKHEAHIGVHAERLVHSQRKWKKAYRAAKILRCIPTILYVGITGSLAMNNAGSDDDIDICIIASKGTVWITRFFATLIIELTGKRRHPGSTNIRNAICLNMFLSEQKLAMPKDQQDVYIAHELLQMVPMWERKPMEQKLLKNNIWVKQLYHHAYMERVTLKVKKVKRQIFWEKLFTCMEKPARYIQMRYMARRRTTETVKENIILFHPKDFHKIVLGALNQSLKKSTLTK